MILKLVIITFAILLIIAVVGYARDTTPRKRVRTVIRSEQDLRIVGDGAWITPRPSAPRSARVRDIEPRGA